MAIDITYNKEQIDNNPIWKLAFWMSEVDNNHAPIGWGNYINLARIMLDKFNITEKE